eukprot:TRINITY_DN35685_c0_g1_i1.p1 TRINITY_DN35685_c0_g1~~TRINITY_DN35685_c0_g1_i1.p1  ORF type:complete len:931 (+),score=327.18 TRINITY_DN35685_c0_g1_i1:75-2867(+)
MRGVAFACVALLACARPVAGLHEEDAGRWDWLKEAFGPVLHAEFAPTTLSGRASRLVFVAGANTVGAVLHKPGTIVWRRTLGEGRTCTGLSLVGSATVAAVTDRSVVAYGLEDGAVLGEAEFEDAHVLGASGADDKQAAKLVSLVQRDGALSLSLRSIDSDDHMLHLETAQTVALPTKLTTDAAAAAESFTVTDNAVLLTAGGQLHVLSIKDGKWGSPVALPGSGATRTVATCQTGAVLSRGSETLLINIAKREVSAVPAKAASDAVGCVDGSDGPFAVVASGSGKTLTVTGGSVSWDLADTQTARYGQPRRAWMGKWRDGWRAMASMDDGSTVYAVGQGNTAKQLWTREDGVGGLVDSVMVDIPHVDDSSVPPTELYSHLLLAQVEAVKSFATTLPQRAIKFVHDVTGEDFGHTWALEQLASKRKKGDLVPDHFGLERLAVIATRTAISTLHTATGNVVWQKHLGTLLAERRVVEPHQVAEVRRLFTTGVDREHPLLVAWVRVEDSFDVVVQFSHVDGAVADVHRFPAKMQSGAVVRTPRSREKHSPIVFVDDSQQVHVYPKKSLEATLEGTPDLYFHHVDVDGGALRGYVVTRGGAQPVWTVRLDNAAGEKIVATSLSSQNPFLYTVKDNVRVLPNKTAGKNEVHTKYINPNAVLIVTHVADDRSPKKDEKEPKDGKKQGGYLVLYLVDGVTGALLASMVQTNAQPPVQVLALEHMFVYHFLNTKRVRYQLGVWELFDDLDKYRGITAESTTRLSFLLQSIAGRDFDHVASAFSQPPPQLSPIAFTFPSPVRALGATVSQKGIQPKHLICGLSTDEIVTVDLHRHIAAQLQTGVTLVVSPPTSTVSHNRTVFGLDTISTFPTNLESTSLMLASGQDLFFSRVSPEKPFDLLGEDFGYSMLSLTLLVISLATWVCSVLSSRNKLKAQWI